MHVCVLDIEGSRILKMPRSSGWMGSIEMKCSEGQPTRSDPLTAEVHIMAWITRTQLYRRVEHR